MQGIEREIKAGRYATACRDLDRLLSWKADPKGGLLYLLGSCELARGRPREAGAAWERVPPGSAFAERAIRGRMRLLHETGQFAAGERLITAAAEDPRNDRTALFVLLVPMFRTVGRIEEAVRFVEDRWEHLNALGEGALEPTIKLLQLHIELTCRSIPAESDRAFLNGAARLTPEDDRVWLGRANLAIRTGDFDEAGRWLDACQQRRPEDVPVWRARLNWGLATDRIEIVQQAMTHLPAAETSPAQLHRLNAWLASKQGDLETERRELERLLVVDPSDVLAVERLAHLAEKAGEPARAAELRREKEEIARRLARYEKLSERKQPLRDAVEMARLAERLGRRFEARGFLTLAIADDPQRADLNQDLERLSRASATVTERGQTGHDVQPLKTQDVAID
jgi:tetratricopeptide (TPR) repeat protein